MTTASPRCAEPFRTTLARTVAIAAAIGAILAWRWGGINRWPAATLIALWPSLGGHYVELFYLNALRPLLPDSRPLRTAARLALWFGAGILFAQAMAQTASALAGFRPVHPIAWWIAGLAFIGIELIAHAFLQSRGRPSFYDGRG
jgi:hypothetical protein